MHLSCLSYMTIPPDNQIDDMGKFLFIKVIPLTNENGMHEKNDGILILLYCNFQSNNGARWESSMAALSPKQRYRKCTVPPVKVFLPKNGT